MLKNYLKIAVRSLLKNKVNTIINILGLSVGLACCLLIGLYVQNEWTYDSFHSTSDRLYRAWVHENYGDGEIYFNTVTPLILSSTLENNIPEVEATTRFINFLNLVKRPEQENTITETISMVDTTFLRMFDFRVIEGNPETIIDNPSSVVLTRESAGRYFGDQNPLQKVLSIKIGDTFQDFTVTGVTEDPPVNSSIQFDLLIPFSNSSKLFSKGALTSWFNVSTETYVLLKKGARPAGLEPKLASMMHSELGDRYGEEYLGSDLKYTVGLQPITDIHLNTEMPLGIAGVSDPVYSYILIAVAVLVLVIACVNFMTLSISRSVSRAKEVVVRKTVGAQRQHLMYQFWGEALMMTMFALIVGALIAELLLPQFNVLSGTELSLTFDMGLISLIGGLALFVSIIAGGYPALVLSALKPIEVLKGKLNLSADKNMFRKSMVVFQFTLSIALIAGTLIINKQLNFMRSTDLGYQKEHIVVLESDLAPGPGNPFSEVFQEASRLKDRLVSEWSGTPDIVEVSLSAYTPIQSGGWISADFKESDESKREFNFNVVDHSFVEAYDIEVINGRNFSENNPSDKRRAILVNKALVDDYGWVDPIGRRLPGASFGDHEIIGVVENFHYQSLHTKVEPLVLTINPSLIFGGIDNVSFSGSPNARFSLRLDTQNLSGLMSKVEGIWSEVAPGIPFNFTFVDQAVDEQYRQEERLSLMVIVGSSLAIIIACLGLFGLASLMVIRRRKEIGVRKVLGASSSQLVLLINREFTKLVAIAFVLAVPIAWVVLSKWLQDFAYHIQIGIGTFILTGAIALGIAWLTVGYQSLKAALVNPVESIRNE